ncbi:MAG: glycosyltransferase family 2 protein [Opitutaceae bacterium]|nr:glycosyltransferase family 2 protein [Opitutaceae bacterium]
MINGRKIVVVFPAYNAEKTLLRTYEEVVAQGVVDHIILVDDQSLDRTVAVARTLPGVHVIVHERNRGYGANQKTCYRTALEQGADVVVMVHPDYQYTPKLITALASVVAYDVYPCALGSRILGGHAFRSGMPWWRYVSNRVLTLFQNLMLNAKLSEYHTGYRAFSRRMLEQSPLEAFDDDFIFDNQMLVWILGQGYGIGEVTCPTKYFADASSISFRRSVRYGLGCIRVALAHRLSRNAPTQRAAHPTSPDATRKPQPTRR